MKQNQDRQATNVDTGLTKQLQCLSSIHADQITDADVRAVSRQVGVRPGVGLRKWKKIIAAAVRVILSRKEN